MMCQVRLSSCRPDSIGRLKSLRNKLMTGQIRVNRMDLEAGTLGDQ